MVTIRAENLGDLSVVECKGRIVHSDAVFQLRDVVQAHAGARVIVLDLSEVKVIGGGGLGMLAFLQRWARQRDIRLQLFCPSPAVLEGLAQNRSITNFEIATFHEMMDVLAHSDSHCSLAA